jgi:uncharacterized alpha-E superfamily protein
LAALDVVMMDPTNPRALAGVLRRLRSELAKLPVPADAEAAASSAVLDTLWQSLPTEGAGVDLAAMCRPGLDGLDVVDGAALEALCEGWIRLGMRLSDALSQRHFSVLGALSRLVAA